MCQAPARHAHCPVVLSISLADARLLRLNFTRTGSFSAKNALTALDSRNTQSCETHVPDSSVLIRLEAVSTHPSPVLAARKGL